MLGRWDLHQSKARPQLPKTSQNKVLLYLPPYGSNSNVKLCPPPISTTALWGKGVRADLGGRKWYQLKCSPHIPFQLLYTLQAYLAPFGYNTPQQTDRAMPKGRLCYSISGLKMADKHVVDLGQIIMAGLSNRNNLR